jgi:hypothetical protein
MEIGVPFQWMQFMHREFSYVIGTLDGFFVADLLDDYLDGFLARLKRSPALLAKWQHSPLYSTTSSLRWLRSKADFQTSGHQPTIGCRG